MGIFFFLFLCLLAFEDLARQGGGGVGGGGGSRPTQGFASKKKKSVEYIMNQDSIRKKKSSLHCTYFIPLLCAFYLPSMQGATGPFDPTTPPVQ